MKLLSITLCDSVGGRIMGWVWGQRMTHWVFISNLTEKSWWFRKLKWLSFIFTCSCGFQEKISMFLTNSWFTKTRGLMPICFAPVPWSRLEKACRCKQKVKPLLDQTSWLPTIRSNQQPLMSSSQGWCKVLQTITRWCSWRCRWSAQHSFLLLPNQQKCITESSNVPS